MVLTVGRRILKNERRFVLKGVTLEWQIGFSCLRIGSSGSRHISTLFTILVFSQFEILRSIMAMLQYCVFTYTCDILCAFLTCFSERVSCYCWSFRICLSSFHYLQHWMLVAKLPHVWITECTSFIVFTACFCLLQVSEECCLSVQRVLLASPVAASHLPVSHFVLVLVAVGTACTCVAIVARPVQN